MFSMILGVLICAFTLIQLYAVKKGGSVLTLVSGVAVVLLSTIRFGVDFTGWNGCLLVIFSILQGNILTREVISVMGKGRMQECPEIALEVLNIKNPEDVLRWGRMKSMGESLSCGRYLTEECGLGAECAECNLIAAVKHVGDSQYVQCFIKNLGTSERIGIIEYKQSTLEMAQSLIPYLHVIYIIPEYRGKGIEKKVIYALREMGGHLWE